VGVGLNSCHSAESVLPVPALFEPCGALHTDRVRLLLSPVANIGGQLALIETLDSIEGGRTDIVVGMIWFVSDPVTALVLRCSADMGDRP